MFKNLIIEENSLGLQETMKGVNHIKDVLKGIKK